VFGGLVFFGFTGSGGSAVLPCWFSSTSSLLSFNSADFSGSICCSCGSETFFCRSGVFALDVLLPSLLSQMCFVYLPLFPDSFSSLLRFAGHIALRFTSAASEELGLNLFQSLSEFG
jgi:hypothetical protein